MPQKSKQVHKNKVKRYGFLAVGISPHSHRHCIGDSWIQIRRSQNMLIWIFVLNPKYETWKLDHRIWVQLSSMCRLC